MEKIEAEIVMLSTEDGGRISPLSGAAFGGIYRPHIVIGDRNQRKAIVEVTPEHPRTLTEKYQGVAFIEGPEVEFVPVNERIHVVMALMYFPDNVYEDVIPGATFTLREGGKIVGHGEILKRWSDEKNT